MRIPKEIAEDIFLDRDEQTIAVCVDRVSLMLDIEEFMNLVKRVEKAKNTLVDEGLIAVGVEGASDNVVPFKQGYSLPDDDEFH